MENSRPFDIILDSYRDESAQLYAVVRTLLNYPSITEDEDLEGKFYASAFTFIVQDYLAISNDCFRHEDFELFIEEMNFKIDEDSVNKMFIQLKLQLKDNDEGLFKEVVWAMIQYYEKSIKKDLGNLFVKRDKLIKLFASIYSLSDDVYMPSAEYSDFDFFNDFK